MKRFLVLVIIAFLISGGTVGILYQEGIGGISGDTDKLPVTGTGEDMDAAAAEEQDIASSYNESSEEGETLDASDSESSTGTSEEASFAGLVSEEETKAQIEAEAEAQKALNEGVKDDTATTETTGDDELDEAVKEKKSGSDKESEDAKSSKEAKEPGIEVEEAESDLAREKEAKAPFYGFEVTGYKGSPLTIHSKPTGKDEALGTVKIGTKGYVIENSDEGRILVYVDGKVGYLSNSGIKKAEIDIEDYPDALLSVTGDNVGEKIEL